MYSCGMSMRDMRDVHGRGGCVYVHEGIWKLSILSAQLCRESKTALKNEVY